MRSTPKPAPSVDQPRLGKVLLLSSGETSTTGRSIHERLFRELDGPVRVAVLETPAGFELNSATVAQRVADFLTHHLQNFSPEVALIPARRREGQFGTNNADVVEPLRAANYIYLGAGSPTYLVGQLRDSLAFTYLLERCRMGATLSLASSAAIAFGRKTMPVYEIFKVGADPYWEDGLDFFGLFGLNLAIVSHWNNNDGGKEVDTSRCYIGRPRMHLLMELLPADTVVVGLDEHTGLLIDFHAEECQVIGKSGVTILSSRSDDVYKTGATFSIRRLGRYDPPPALPDFGMTTPDAHEPSAEILALIGEREEARLAKNWSKADEIKDRVAQVGFKLQDTPEGTTWRRIEARRGF